MHVKERAGPWKFPRWIDVRADLPRTATGKLQRFKLRDMDSTAPVTDFIFRRQFAIEWGHCDPAGIVFNSRFFEFFDRSAWLMFEAALGVPPHELSKPSTSSAFRWSDAQAKFLAPAKFGDVADMESRVVRDPALELRRRRTRCSSAARSRSRAWRSACGPASIPTIRCA